MSSSSIYATIVSCQSQIDSLNATVNRLRHKIADQEAALYRFRSTKEHYWDEFGERKRCSDAVCSHRIDAVFSERFKARSDVEWGQERSNAIYQAMEEIQREMSNEINTHYETLEQQEATLRQSHNRISQLNYAHASALRTEEAQRIQAQQDRR